MRSSVALAFVGAYSPRMSGGFLRFQAQYLRRIRCPRWETLPDRHHELLIEAASQSPAECDAAVFEALEIGSASGAVLAAYAQRCRVGGGG